MNKVQYNKYLVNQLVEKNHQTNKNQQVVKNHQINKNQLVGKNQQVEKNKKELESLKIYHAQKTCEYVGLDRISTVEEMLKNTGSNVKAPGKPADIIKK